MEGPTSSWGSRNRITCLTLQEHDDDDDDICFCFTARQTLVSQGLPIVEASRSHSDTPHSVGLLWTTDQLHAGTYTWQDTFAEMDTYVTGGIRTRNTNKRAVADPPLRRHDLWDRLLNISTAIVIIIIIIIIIIICGSKGRTSDPDSNIIHGNNSRVTITKSNKT